MQVLLVEDNDELGQALVEMLHANGYQATWCRRSAVAFIAHLTADVIVLDLGTPVTDGLQAWDRLRRLSSAPLLVLANKDDQPWVTRMRRAEADECLIKPVKPRELLARLKMASRWAEMRSSPVVEVRDVSVNFHSRTVLVGGKPVALTIKEFDVLAVLARDPGQAVSRKQIMHEVWGGSYRPVSRSLDVHMTALRAKLDRPELLQTLRGFGYRFGPASTSSRPKVATATSRIPIPRPNPRRAPAVQGARA
jgi:DNA-binding response OmpR family regulator